MRTINKKIILLFCLMCAFIVPKVNGMDKIEETIFLTPGSSNQFYVSLEKGEVISWEFETYNNSFLTTLTIYLSSLEFICIEKEEGSYTINIDKTYEYQLGVWNRDDVDGYVHYVIKNKKSSIVGYTITLLVFFSILILTVYKRKHSSENKK